MELSSARELKSTLRESLVEPIALRAAAGYYGIAAQKIERTTHRRSIALGIARRTARDFVLAVRIQQRILENSGEIDQIRNAARGEVDVQYVGKIGKCSVPWFRQRQRPLCLGSSAAHYNVTAGTIGCFVRSSGNGDNRMMILSNNHVL